MSKKTIGFIEISLWSLALLMLLLVISPYVMGLLVKKDYRLMLQNVARSLQGEVSILQYQQGYFKSSIRYEIVFSKQAKLEFSEEIIHGPLYLGLINQGQSPFVAAVVQGKLLHGDVSGFIKPWLKDSEFIYQNVMAYNGDTDIQAYLPAQKHQLLYAQQNHQFASSAFHVEASYNSLTKFFLGEVKLPSFYLKTDAGKYSAKKIELSFMLQATQGLFLEGDGLLSLQHFEYQSSNEQWVLQNLIVQLQNEQRAGRLNLASQINVSKAFASNERFGPLQFNLHLSNLDVDAVQNLLTTRQTFSSSNLETSISTFLPLLFKGAKFELRSFDLASDLGDMQAQFVLSSETMASMTSADPLALLSVLNLSLTFNVEKALMQQIVTWQLLSHVENKDLAQPVVNESLKQQVKQNLQGLVADNWLSFDQQVYRCQLELSQGQARLNQQQVDPLAHIMSKIQSASAVQ